MLCVLGMMRWFRFALILSVSLLTVGLQAAPGPYVLCVSKCEIGDSGVAMEMVCWSGPSETGCSAIIAGSADFGERELDEIELADLGCCVADASCPPFESCPQFPPTSDQSRPYGMPEYFFCLPGRILADKAPQSHESNNEIGCQMAGLATAQLAMADFVRQSSHTHSPPGPLLAESGSDICIEICLLLI